MKALIITLAIGSLLNTALQAQSPNLSQVQVSLKANEAKLRTYTYRERVTVSSNGPVKSTKLYKVCYDLDGQKQRISLTPAQPMPRERGLRGKIMESKIEKAKDYLDDLGRLADRYLHPDRTATETMMAKAEVSSIMVNGTSFIQLQAWNLLQLGDSLRWMIDPATQQITKIAAETALDGDPVRIRTEFAKAAAEGPVYPASSQIRSGKKDTQTVIETYDLRRV